MKTFFKYIAIWSVLVILLLELTIRIFDLAAKTMPTQNVDGNYLFAPGKSGFWVRGGLGELTNYYEINKQGYNSIIDYDRLDPKNLNIALIGDSYIQGFQTDVRQSIGRQLEDTLGDNTVVHEYGKAGSNIVDFSIIHNKYIQPKSYDFTFILATNGDLKPKKPSNMGKGNKIPEKTINRQMYNNVHILRYLNINHGLGINFNKLINQGPESIDRIYKEKVAEVTEVAFLNKINVEAIKTLPKSIIFLYEGDKLSPYFMENFDFEFKKIIHDKLPKDHGFDGHWNKNGRYNCAKAMAEYIRHNQDRIKN